MELITPGLGLIIWTSLSFILLLLILTKFAWKPILSGLNERETNIADALASAEKAKADIQKLQADNAVLLNEARAERDKILREASSAAADLIAQAKGKAETEGARAMEQAKLAIANEQKAAIDQIKNTAATLSVEIAEKLLRRELQDAKAQQDLVQEYIKVVNFN